MKPLFLLAGLLLFTQTVFADAARPGEEADAALRQVALELDRRLFERGFNECRLDELATLIAPQLRFFHDVGGLQDRQEFLSGMQKAICGRADEKPIRRLVPGTSQVFPLYKSGRLYGLIHQGIHEFYLRDAEKPLRATNVARFTLVWLKSGEDWLLDTALSFDHRKP